MLKQLHLKNNLLFLFLLVEVLVYGQQYPSINYDVSDGLPTNVVRTVLKASNGVVWIGTDSGIVRLVNGKIERYVSPKLTNVKVWDLQQSKDGSIWVGTYGKGVFKIFDEKINSYNLKDKKVRKIFIKNNISVIGTEKEVLIINGEKITNLHLKDSDKFRLQVQDFFEHKNEVYVVSYRAGLFKILNLERNPKLTKVRDYYHAFATGFFDNKIYHSIDGKIKTYSISDFIKGKEETSSFGTSIAWDYAKTKKGKLFTASWGVHSKNGGVYSIKNNKILLKNNLFGIKSKTAWGITYDDENEFLYVSTLDKGLYKVDVSEKIKFTPTNSKVESLGFIDKKKVILTEKKLKIIGLKDTFSINGNDFIKFKKSTEKLNPLLTKVVHYGVINKYNSIKEFNLNSLEIKQNDIWISTNIGIYKISKSGQFLDYLPIHNQLLSFASNGDLICPIAYSHIQVYEEGDFEKRRVFNVEDKPTPTNINQFFKIGDKLFVTSLDKGLYIYNNHNFKSIYKTDNLIYATPKNDSIFYLANNSGKVLEFNLSQKKIIKTLNNKNFKGQSIKFLKYYNENLIIGTEKGINILKDDSQILINDEQGLNDVYVQNIKVNNNKMFVGTNSGYYEIDFNSFITSTKKKFKISIDNLDVNFKKYNFKTDEPINLNYDENSINISWNTVRHPYPKKLEYSYRIKSLDTSWVQLKESKLLLPFVPSGNHLLELKVKDLHFGTNYNQELLEFNISKPLWWKWWFLLMVLLILIASIYYYFNKKSDAKRKLDEIEKRITETKLEALQSQMNPHFTFNAMNSIQNYIIDNDVDNALFFLSEFSKLMRATLNFSSEQRITLEEELEYINRYVLLENMRFGNNVDFKLEIQENIEPSEVYLLPMILQPFIENCFEHAFTKNFKGPVINLRIEENNNLLMLTITDNGQGIKENNFTKLSTSKGIKLVKERLQLIQNITEPIKINSSKVGVSVTITLQSDTLTNSI